MLVGGATATSVATRKQAPETRTKLIARSLSHEKDVYGREDCSAFRGSKSSAPTDENRVMSKLHLLLSILSISNRRSYLVKMPPRKRIRIVLPQRRCATQLPVACVLHVWSQLAAYLRKYSAKELGTVV